MSVRASRSIFGCGRIRINVRTITTAITAWLEADVLQDIADVTLIDAQAKHVLVFDCKVLADAFRTKLRRVAPTGSVDFDRQLLLAAYDNGFAQQEIAGVQAACELDVFTSLCSQATPWEECVESSGLNPFLALFQFFSFIVDEIARRCREAVRFKAKALAGSIAIGLRHRLRCGLKFKHLHTPLQLFPRSIHPIELSA